jgi:sugar phosphate permease
MSALWMFYLFYLFNAVGYVCEDRCPIKYCFRDGLTKLAEKRWVRIPWYWGWWCARAVGFKWLTDEFGWRGSLRSIGILMIVLALPMAYFVKDSPRGMVEKRDEATIAPMGSVFRSRVFYLLALGSMCSIGAVGGTNQHLKLFLSLDQHYEQGDAVRIISMVLTFSIVGRLLMGWLADYLPKKYVMLLIYLLVASAIPLLFFASQPAIMYLFAVVFGLGLGGEYLIIPLIAAELFGVKVLGRLMGVILTADGVAEATAPMLVGYLRDQSNTYQTGFITLICIALLGAIAIASLPRKRQESGLETLPALAQ